jgi:acyl-CoA synthetase (AMP-forming)/AMP-acid ligase II
MFLRDYIRRCAATFPEDIGYKSGACSLSWAEADRRSTALAGALQALGLRKGSAVAILSRNRTEIAEHWLACLKAGMLRVGINRRYSEKEVLHVLNDCAASALLVDAGCAGLLENHFDTLRANGTHLVGFGPDHGMAFDYEELIARGHPAQAPELGPEDPALIGYTSGSTGLPKGVLLTQRNVREFAVHLSLAAGFVKDDVRLPFMNPAGVNIANTCANLVTGMATVIEEFNADDFPGLVAEHRVTCASLAPTMLRRVIDVVRRGDADIRTLRQVMYGTMPTPPALIRQAYEALDCTFLQLYGASESSGPVTALRDSEHRRAIASEPELLASVGRALPHAEVSIRDEEGREVPRGEPGTVWLGGPTIMAGYLNLPDETAAALHGGWLRTGDLGRMDARGYIFLGDRKKNMIITGGMNVYPASVENALAEHPAVREAVVVGVPHPEWGEAVVAMVTLWLGAEVSPDELVSHCRASLPRWEVPKHVSIAAALPHGFTDKIDKKAVRAGLISAGLPWSVEA